MTVDRKVLADLAVTDPTAFTALVEVARAAVAGRGHRRRRRPVPGGRNSPAQLEQRPARRRAPSHPTDGAARGRAFPCRGRAGGPRGAGRRCRRRAVRDRRGDRAPPRPDRATPPRSARKDAAALSETVTPQGLVAVCRRIDVPLARRARPAPGWSRSWSSRTTRATPARSCAPPTPPAPTRSCSSGASTSTTARRCGPAPAACSTCASSRRRRRRRRARRAGLTHAGHHRRRRASTSTTWSTTATCARPTLWLFGSEAHGLPDAVLDARRPTPSGCRSTAGPRASTSPPPPPCASTPAPAPSAADGQRAGRRSASARRCARSDTAVRARCWTDPARACRCCGDHRRWRGRCRAWCTRDQREA